tara:strand:- start:211 stop:336 length:126 start_codon:yes stop_codon:yes gene_type:complete
MEPYYTLVYLFKLKFILEKIKGINKRFIPFVTTAGFKPATF